MMMKTGSRFAHIWEKVRENLSQDPIAVIQRIITSYRS